MILGPLLLWLVQTAAPTPAQPVPPPAYSSRRAGKLFISPMGEPFRPAGRDDDTLADWFRQANRSHDGKLTIEEMIKDAERFFAVLDLNHDGEIDPDEIAHYEKVIAPEVQTGEHFDVGSDDSNLSSDSVSGERGSRGGHGGRRRGGDSGGDKRFFRSLDSDQHQGAGRYGLLDLPEPVVAADANFDRAVSLTEFRAAAQQRFLALDIDHKGYLTLDGLESIRPAPPPAPNKPPEQAPTENDFPPSPG